jgi:hypothetical protein
VTKPLESEIEGAFVKYAQARGCYALKLRLDGRNGWPDRTVIGPEGLVMFVEFKRPGSKLRPMQRVWVKVLESQGFVVIRPTRIGEAEAKLDELLGQS